jgi:hypothetical protein
MRVRLPPSRWRHLGGVAGCGQAKAVPDWENKKARRNTGITSQIEGQKVTRRVGKRHLDKKM